MKHCYHCNHVTPGEPLFCNYCGRSYDVKLCPRLHLNGRNAEVCSQCGSREFSTPQPKMPFRTRALIVLTMFVSGAVLLLASLFFIVEVLKAALSNAQVQGAAIGLVILIALLWWMWLQIPHWLRKIFERFFHSLRREKGGRS
jgi:RNA polymerase subunit RPABC4/transcription elongation factor Spt4